MPGTGGAGHGNGSRRAAAAALALWCLLAACAPAPGIVPGPTGSAAPAAAPAPQPQAPALPQATAASAAAPAGAPGTAAPTTGAAAPSGFRTVTTYYVLLDDGGRNGVRFGCNDSLVGASRQLPAATAAAPLRAALGPLLGPVDAAENIGSELPEGSYNALAGSTLTLLSGSFDGTTVTVYLAGSLNPGGVCDVPRLEMQLTQTAVAAVGAIRATIYINGLPLAQSLRLN